SVRAVGRGTNRCGPHRRRTVSVSATRINPSPVTGISDPPYATGTNGSTSVNASSSHGAAVEASTASEPTTPTARERVVRDKAGCNENEGCKNRQNIAKHGASFLSIGPKCSDLNQPNSQLSTPWHSSTLAEQALDLDQSSGWMARFRLGQDVTAAKQTLPSSPPGRRSASLPFPPCGRREVRGVTSHRRRNSVAADVGVVGFERAVVLLHRTEDDDLGTRLQFGLVAGNEGDDRRIRRHHDFLFTVLVLDQNV